MPSYSTLKLDNSVILGICCGRNKADSFSSGDRISAAITAQATKKKDQVNRGTQEHASLKD